MPSVMGRGPTSPFRGTSGPGEPQQGVQALTPALCPRSFRRGFFLVAASNCPPHPSDLPSTHPFRRPTHSNGSEFLEWFNPSSMIMWRGSRHQTRIVLSFPVYGTLSYICTSPRTTLTILQMYFESTYFSVYHFHQPSPSHHHSLSGLVQFLPTCTLVPLQSILHTTARWIVLHCKSD